MEKNYLFDVDGLLEVLQAIKEGRPVMYLDEKLSWQDFDPFTCDIDTKNCVYSVKSNVYGEDVGSVVVSPESLQEDRIYFLQSKDHFNTSKGFICVKLNLWQENKNVFLHFFWESDGVCRLLRVCDPNVDECHSEPSHGFANVIGSDLSINHFDDFYIFQPSLSQVKMLEKKLREIGYEFKNGDMTKLNGNKA